MDDLIALGQKGGKKIIELLETGRGGLGQGAVLPVAAVHVGRGVVGPVQKALLPQKNGQGQNFYIIAGKQLLRKIAGAVRGDHYGFAHAFQLLYL